VQIIFQKVFLVLSFGHFKNVQNGFSEKSFEKGGLVGGL
jgi:hypothetical protein